jgi:hypothetical protein
VLVEETLPYLAGVGIDEFYLDPESCVLSFELGRSRLKNIFTDDVTHPGISCPPISYGHVACLGCGIIFPPNSEPYAKPAFASLDEGIGALEGEVDFSENWLYGHYLKMHVHLKKAFPSERVAFGGFGWEGPITSAGLLRGQGFFSDIHREPEKAKLFLKLVTASIKKFIHFIRETNGEAKMDPNGSGLADDHASFIPPHLWAEFVLPHWDQYYRGITTGKRVVHCENLGPGHLRYLTEAGITFYEPSVSPKLNPKIIKECTNIPFNWLLPTFKLRAMADEEEVRQWVIQAASMGADHIWAEVDRFLCEEGNPNKIVSFVNTCKEIAQQA